MKIKNLVLSSLILLTLSACNNTTNSNSPNPSPNPNQENYLSWLQQSGSANGIILSPTISTDNNGYIYVSGSTNEPLFRQSQNGNYDYFIEQYNPSGSLIWIRQYGSQNASTYSLADSTDNNGNSYIGGTTNGNLDGNNLIGLYDAFLSKYDNNGNLKWVDQFGGINGTTDINGISSVNNNVGYATGETSVGLNHVSQTGKTDAFLIRFDNNGNISWTKQLGEVNQNTTSFGVTTVKNFGVFITGTTNGSLDGKTKTTGSDYFVSKYGSLGNFSWTQQLGGNNGFTTGKNLITDSNGNVYVVGTTTVSLNGQTQHGQEDYFISKYDTNGNLLWIHQYGYVGAIVSATQIKIDNNNNIYVSGSTTASLKGQTQHGNSDYFVSKYDENGNLLWNRQLGKTDGQSNATGLNIDQSNNIFVSGTTNVGLNGQKQQGKVDFFLSKYNDSNS